MQHAAAVRSARHRFAAFATIRRSVGLFSAFRVEQTDPATFYGTLASDTVTQIETFTPLSGARVLDVGGGPGYFRAAFDRAGSGYLSVDHDRTELAAAGLLTGDTVIGSGMQLPVRTGAVDLCVSSNVLEHVPDPELMADEMVRVTRPGGLVYLSYTLWLSPWGGHETSPWHLLGGHRAARRYTRRHGHGPKNLFGTSLYALSAGRMLTWAQRADDEGRVDVLAAFPRYLPAKAYWLLLVPGLRELLMWNLVLVLRRR